MESEIVEKFMISKEDFEKYFGSRKIIKKNELDMYYKNKNKCSKYFPIFSRLSFK